MSTINVSAGQNLQAVLDTAVSGDEVVLEAGVTFPGSLTLLSKGSPDLPVIVRGATRAPDRRVTAADAGPMPKIVGDSVDPAVTTNGGGGYRFEGIQFLPTQDGMYNMIYTPGAASHIAMDRCVFIGDGVKGQKNAIGMNGAHILVERCHIANIWTQGDESHGFVAWDGPGPYIIRNNYIEAGSIGILFGGADSSKPEWMPADILIEDNLVTKRDEWRAGGKAVKNALELKTALRVIIRRNRFEKVWTDAQGGTAILFTTRSDGRAPWSTIEDVLFMQNEIVEVENGLNIGATNDGNPSGQAKNIRLYDNVWQCSGNFGMVAGELTDLVVEHNTIFNGGTLWIFTGGWIMPAGEEPRHPRYAVKNFTFRDNLAYMNEYGVFGDEGVPWRDYIVGELNWTHCALANRYGSAENQTMPGVNWYPTRAEHEAQFEGDTTVLIGASPYQTAATNGGPLGTRVDPPDPPPIDPPIDPPEPAKVIVRIMTVDRAGKSSNYKITAEAEGLYDLIEFYIDEGLGAVLTVEPFTATVKITKPGTHILKVVARLNDIVVGESSWTIEKR